MVMEGIVGVNVKMTTTKRSVRNMIKMQCFDGKTKAAEFIKTRGNERKMGLRNSNETIIAFMNGMPIEVWYVT